MNLRKILHSNNRRAIIVIAACIISVVLAGCTSARTYNSDRSPNAVSNDQNALNINTASAAELEIIPHIGAGLASKIVEHRERYGAFRKVEDIMLIDGISNKRFREIEDLIKVE